MHANISKLKPGNYQNQLQKSTEYLFVNACMGQMQRQQQFPMLYMNDFPHNAEHRPKKCQK
jgi:division protein CdvB (Snf7/Vps24/ESCRT-III family)